jgi:hypothetical protein
VHQAIAATEGGHPHGEHANMPGMNGGSMMARPVSWTQLPLLKTRMSGESRETMVTTVVPQNIVANGIDAFSNNLKDDGARRQLPLEMAGAKLDKPANGGFHWLAAREESIDAVHIASTVYSFGERSPKDPTAMFMQQKHELEIIPSPFPREHSRYRANEDWKFIVHFNGQPLVGQKVVLETQNGSKAEWVSDAQGVVTVHVPDDFKPEEVKPEAGKHSHGMPGADFVLATEHAANGKTYLTAFNGSYGKNAFDKRSLEMGLGFTLLGMLGAVPLLRKRNTEKKNQETGNA